MTEPEPNEKTAQVIRDARAGKGVVRCENADEMFSKLWLGESELDRAVKQFADDVTQIVKDVCTVQPKPPAISQATARRLMEACEKFSEYHVRRHGIDGWEFYDDALDLASSALAAARAELAGEATNAPVRHTDV